MPLALSTAEHSQLGTTILSIADRLKAESGSSRFYIQRLCKAGSCGTCRQSILAGRVLDCFNGSPLYETFLACSSKLDPECDILVFTHQR